MLPRFFLGDQSLDDLPDRTMLFFKWIILSDKTIDLVIDAQRRRIYVGAILEKFLSQEIIFYQFRR